MEDTAKSTGIMIISYIRCWNCGEVIEDYDPEIDQYSCKDCRGPEYSGPTLGPDDDIYSQSLG